MSTSRYHNLRVEQVVQETADAVSLQFALTADQVERFRYRPGQFLTLRLPWQGEHLLRCYSMSSAPTVDAQLRVTVKRVVEGRGSNWICDHVRPGDEIEVMQPAGVFVPETLDGEFLLFAGGSGITPVFSILRSVLLRGRGQVRLIYANRDEQSIIFREALKELGEQYADRFDVIHLLDSVQGRPNVSLLRRLARGMESAQAFICGPGPFMDAAEAALQELKLPGERVHVERFVSLPSEESRDQEQREALTESAEIDQAQVSIELDGHHYELQCQGDETILDAAEKAGIELPYSCMAGMCASCMCEVTEGEVKLLHNDVLDERDLSKGLTLTCQAVPTTTRVHLKYT
ncbi:ferredoxin--NADP reductase [Marinobacterium sediminicola]|uniref:3-ketosteroid 9alpha-monooxygenase subunit B n=1 Tax=Marinobacterium sediminicola TaxID=518898 RepID=A0ABY1S416_9GAMM|nr:ferredoxin--NADP reductase [Marinobacterium sediminicola]ULG70157.1 ferredoxin--NADP reductase [Marinobacterium sediminicola]SMR78373.1 3-ketosteroid 9alpha-monooxygenase subunit B [Marinobacterium sediminicola]